MTVTIYGLLGHAGKLDVPLEALDVEELAFGEEFVFDGRVYEIRSVSHCTSAGASDGASDGASEGGGSILMNVSLVMNHAVG